MNGKLRVSAVFFCMLVGCDGIGRAVVGEHVPELGDDLCDEPLPCASITLDQPEGVPKPAEPVDLTYCPQAGGVLCTSSSTTPASQCSEPSGPLELTFSEVADAALSCRAVHLVHHAGEPATLSVALSLWNRLHVEVESVEPVTLELTGGQLTEVSFALRGPITLRVLDVTRTRDLRVLADNGRAHIELIRATLTSLAIAAPEGDVLLRRSTLSHITLQAERINLESAYVTDAEWSAASLSAADVTLRRVRSAAQHSVLSACNVEMTSFSECQSLSTIQGIFRHVQVFACAEEAGIYGSDVLSAQIEGDLILDRAGLTDSVLGVGEVGSIMAWDSQLSDISFCAAEQPLVIGGTGGARCAHCDLTPMPSEPSPCLLDAAFLRSVKSPSCPALDQLKICGDPQPQRMRPPLR